jgi:L-fucose isomerase-like protein
MTKISVMRLDSGRHDKNRFERDRREFLAPLPEKFEMIAVRPGEKAEADLQVVFIASGGSEEKFRRHYRDLARPIVLLADGRHNSLPAALEISAWIRQQGERAEIVHGNSRFVIARLKELARFQRVRKVLGGRIGVIGRPSGWLIGSGVDRLAIKKRWGTRLVDIRLQELAPRARGGEAAAIAREFIEQAKKLDGVDERAVMAAAGLVPALRAVFLRQRLQAATLRCFSLIEALGTSGCLALSRLNDEGRVCGCEGDVPSVFSMLLLFSLTGEHPFLANPAQVDKESNQVVLAHCTVPRRAVDGYVLQTHFETGTGVALCGHFPPGPATVFKAGGPGLGSYFVSSAEFLPHRPRPGLCRTQVRLRLREPAGYFLRASLANHHLLVRGDHAELINDFMSYSGAVRIE